MGKKRKKEGIQVHKKWQKGCSRVLAAIILENSYQQRVAFNPLYDDLCKCQHVQQQSFSRAVFKISGIVTS